MSPNPDVTCSIGGGRLQKCNHFATVLGVGFAIVPNTSAASEVRAMVSRSMSLLHPQKVAAFYSGNGDIELGALTWEPASAVLVVNSLLDPDGRIREADMVR